MRSAVPTQGSIRRPHGFRECGPRTTLQDRWSEEARRHTQEQEQRPPRDVEGAAGASGAAAPESLRSPLGSREDQSEGGEVRRRDRRQADRRARRNALERQVDPTRQHLDKVKRSEILQLARRAHGDPRR